MSALLPLFLAHQKSIAPAALVAWPVRRKRDLSSTFATEEPFTAKHPASSTRLRLSSLMASG